MRIRISVTLLIFEICIPSCTSPKSESVAKQHLKQKSWGNVEQAIELLTHPSLELRITNPLLIQPASVIIYPNGDVIRTKYGKVTTNSVNPDVVIQLLKGIEDQEFFNLSRSATMHEIHESASYKNMFLFDASTYLLRVNNSRIERTFEFEGLEIYIHEYPEVVSLRKFYNTVQLIKTNFWDK